MTGLQHLGASLATGSPFAVVLVWFFQVHGVNMPPEVAVAISTLLSGIGGLTIALFKWWRSTKSVNISSST